MKTLTSRSASRSKWLSRSIHSICREMVKLQLPPTLRLKRLCKDFFRSVQKTIRHPEQPRNIFTYLLLTIIDLTIQSAPTNSWFISKLANREIISANSSPTTNTPTYINPIKLIIIIIITIVLIHLIRIVDYVHNWSRWLYSEIGLTFWSWKRLTDVASLTISSCDTPACEKLLRKSSSIA